MALIENKNPYDNESDHLDDAKFAELEFVRRRTPLAYVGLFAAILSFVFLIGTRILTAFPIKNPIVGVLMFVMSGCFALVSLISTYNAKRFLFWPFIALVCWSGNFLIFGLDW